MGQRALRTTRPRRRVVIAGAVTALALTAGALVFEPWTLWTRSTLHEALPTVSAQDASPAAEDVADPAPSASLEPAAEPEVTESTPSATPPPTPAKKPAPAEPLELTRGDFITQEHGTSGTARVVKLADGSRILRLEGFSTSNGPDLHVWLSDQSAGGDWFKYAGGRSVQLGALKATDGSHNYAIPAGADLGGLNSAVIWCKRFNVAFGSAPLTL